MQTEPFSLQDVRLLDGPYKHAQDKDAEYLLSLKPDRLLAWFRKEAGLETKGAVYGGWEIKEVAGHSAGHFLSACSMMWQATGDGRFRERVNYMVDELATCQQANGNGYVAAIPKGKEVFARIARGEVNAEPYYLNDVWIPWYTIHKLLAGLRDAYVSCDNSNAVVVARRLADWAIDTTRNLNDPQWQKMLTCEHGGMNEVLADLYAITGESKYLTLSKKFYHRAVLDALAIQRDELAGKHANTTIPKLVGCARLYELTGEERFGTASQFFWDTVTRHHSYVTGGDSDDEHFGKADRLNERLSDKSAENCNVYNMLKLTKALFCRDPLVTYADYYERALWNHILASQNPDDGMVCYYLPLRPGARKKFMTPYDDFACCSGTGMENHARYGEAIYFHADDTLYVNQFIASEVNWRAKGLRIRQETDFPKSNRIRLVVACEKPVRATLKIRHPFWMDKKIIIKFNGEAINAAYAQNGYASLDREWNDGDRVEVEFSLQLRSEPMPDNPKRIAILYGPIVLAVDLGPAKEDRAVPVVVNASKGSSDKIPTVTMVSIPEQKLMPVIVSNGRPILQCLKLLDGEKLVFRTDGVGRPKEFVLMPFYQIHDRRYSVYLNSLSESDWQAVAKIYRAEQQRFEAESRRKN
ncbi:MAG: hypothetical protein HOP33_14660 [Verrucomicrobia bacterium]|nr:hypothetical protein [Verrucomicrobiota bacterium]